MDYSTEKMLKIARILKYLAIFMAFSFLLASWIIAEMIENELFALMIFVFPLVIGSISIILEKKGKE